MLKLKKARKTRKGDTLIEIALAIAILGFVVAAVSVTMTSTLSASEFSLEETMARNEIDIQAEALRYIHNAYFAQYGLLDNDKEYDAIWQAIVAQAVPPSSIPTLNNVESCDVFYSSDTSSTESIYNNNSFIINTHNLSPVSTKDASQTNKIVITSKTSDPENSIFQPASIYPRLLYGSGSASDTLLGDSAKNQNLFGAEGIWISVACSQTNNDNTACLDTSEYYDFYIRTCWNSLNKHSTTTLGTIVRLHNPELSSGVSNHEISTFTINYYDGINPTSKFQEETQDYYKHYFLIRQPGGINVSTTRGNLQFAGWCVNYSNSYNSCTNPELTVQHNGSSDSLLNNQILAYAPNHQNLSMVAAYCGNYSVTYQSEGSVSNLPSNKTGKYCRAGDSTNNPTIIPSNAPTRTDYKFNGWYDSATGKTYSAGSTYDFPSSGTLDITLTATWVYDFTATLTFNKNTDLSVSNMPSPLQCESTTNSSCTVTIKSTANPTNGTSTFTGWYYADGTLACKAKSSCTITLTTKTNTVYAHWHSAYLQDMDAAFCASSAFDNSRTVVLIDKRDGKKYNTQRMSSGDCWMTQHFAYNDDALYIGTHQDANQNSQGNYYTSSAAINTCSKIGWRLPYYDTGKLFSYAGYWGYATSSSNLNAVGERGGLWTMPFGGYSYYSLYWINKNVSNDGKINASSSTGLNVECYFDA